MKTPVFLGILAIAALLVPPCPTIHAAPPGGTFNGGKPINARPVPTGQRVTVQPRMLEKMAEAAFLQKFTAEFISRCKTKAVGCVIAAVGPHGLWSEQAVGAARRDPDPSPRDWTANDKITMASVSKVFTGAALLKLLSDKGISADAKIGPYLLPHWKRSKAVDDVTFRQLLTHTSGLPCTEVTYDGLKACLATAQPAPEPPNYHNANFALMRLLIPQIRGMSAATLKPMVDADLAGNSGWIAASHAILYRQYVNDVIFAPAGLPTMQCKPTDALPALSYKSITADPYDFSKVGPGEPWGDIGDTCGSEGWFLSGHQMAQTMRAIMTPGKILPAAVLEAMQKDGLGVDHGVYGGGLEAWYHFGGHPASQNNGEINTLIIHLTMA